MSELDLVVAEPEIRTSLEEFRYSTQALRGAMIADSDRILGTAPREFLAYEEARAAVPGIARRGTGDPSAADVIDWGLPSLVRQVTAVRGWAVRGWAVSPAVRIGQSLMGTGFLLVVAGAVTIPIWGSAGSLIQAGTLVCVAALLALGLSHPATREMLKTVAREALPSDPAAIRSQDRVAVARRQLIEAVGHQEFVAQARTHINTQRKGQFSYSYSVVNSAGLSETYDTTYQVPTNTAADLDGLLTRLDGASIGIAGPRGSGKSTLIRGYCDDFAAGLDLRCMVSAPVDYDARDFVLHLFAVFCRTVMHRYGARPRIHADVLAAAAARDAVRLSSRLTHYGMLYLIPAAALLYWQQSIARFLSVSAGWPYGIGLAIAILGVLRLAWESCRRSWRGRAGGPAEEGYMLASAARRHLTRVRYLQTYTSGWSGTLTLPNGGGQYSRGSSRAEQQLSYPEIVGEFRAFVRDVAAHLHRGNGRIFIGIDELDKISTADQAERFLNQIKGIFGIPHVYFIVSVSDDALMSFERRGLPLRDAFDSSFDEIVYVSPLSYPETRRLLYRRVIGLAEPYAALCHCLAGGLARDIIRAARQVIRAADRLASADRSESPTLSSVCGDLLRDELLRKTRAVIHAAGKGAEDARPLPEDLREVARQLVLPIPGRSLNIVDMIPRPAPDEAAPVAALRTDFVAYAYYCATLRDVFTEGLNAEDMFRATIASENPGSFDALASARHAFSLDTRLAWRMITQFRKAWHLETRDYDGCS
ncbi:MAG: hypothetical protein ACRDN0_03700 [Trebonia sp.]